MLTLCFRTAAKTFLPSCLTPTYFLSLISPSSWIFLARFLLGVPLNNSYILISLSRHHAVCLLCTSPPFSACEHALPERTWKMCPDVVIPDPDWTNYFFLVFIFTLLFPYFPFLTYMNAFGQYHAYVCLCMIKSRTVTGLQTVLNKYWLISDFPRTCF